MPLIEIPNKNVILFFSSLIGIIYFYYYLTSRAPIVKVINERVYKNGTSLRVMTFNIWYGGSKVDNGIQKIAKHIKFIDPDVVAIQEIRTNKVLSEILQQLGSKWTGIQGSDKDYPNNGILTRHKIIASKFSEIGTGVGAAILFNNNKTINFWGLHLFYKSFGLYAAHNKLITSSEQIMAGETHGMFYNGKNYSSRVENIEELLANKKFQSDLEKADQIPLIVAGDFNTPSHLDWIEGNKHLHGGWVFEWPVTKILMEKAKMIDSYRELYPDPLKYPGTTWSSIQRFSGPDWGYTIPEPQDRIDFIFYRCPNMIPKKSYIYAGTVPLKLQEKGHSPYEYNNDWPSDHYAVVTDFFIYTSI